MMEDGDHPRNTVNLLKYFLLIIMFAGFIMVIYGVLTTKMKCQEPYTLIDGECCIDRNVNGVCDEGECLPEVTYGKNASGHCVEFYNSCLPDGFVKTDACPGASCFDGIQNCHDGECETGIDCGGPCTVQVIATCLDGIMNQNETGIDCGGPCPPCILQRPKPICFDGVMNQNETGVDCGGPCPPCLPTCADGVKNQGEEEVDCGGPCPSCITQPREKLVWMYNTTEKINDVSVSANGTSIVFGGVDDYIYFVNESRKLMWSYKTRGDVIAVGLSDDGYYAVAGSTDNYVYSFKKSTRALPATTYSRRYRVGEIRAVDVAANGYSVVSGAEYNVNVTPGEFYREDYIFRLNQNTDVVSSYSTQRNVNHVAISPSSWTVAGVSDDQLFINGRTIDMGWLFTFDYLETVDASDYAVVVGNRDNVYYVSNYELGWIYNTTITKDVAISNNNNVVIGAEKTIVVDGSMKKLWEHDIGHETVKVAISRSGNIVAVFYENRYLYVFDGKGELKWRYFTGDKITALEISPTDDYIAAGSYSGVVYLFKV
ncbi:MAG: WD40 repeat domain-containing protein [Candidatus Altiarchaeota archaeon]